MDPILQDLTSRYTTKRYDATKKVSQKDIEIIFEALRLTPSSINSQPWRFILLESKEAKQRMINTFEFNHQFNLPIVEQCSHIILFAHNPHYSHDDYAKVVKQQIQDGRITEENREKAFGSFRFVEYNTDNNGNNAPWTKAQLYIALGNIFHTLARLKIDSTALEGIDAKQVNKEFIKELDGHICEVALAIGYHDKERDYNKTAPKSRLACEHICLKI